uniref:NADH dehydrogenase [ubiquinone] 1 alpha subcomplex subunit 12 n=1 Tax=Bicosoecida sp. CB-2014 TaxID=1486930 RepID=A0A7S1CQN8_9STRA|mmetsp:Transcript_9575/g.33646  ORF Transcript_9575/g.33646 Transcript_9575/m.33646 type:complete len:308 (+) Transcript_9575:372-1295(+)
MAFFNALRAVREFGVIETARKLHMVKTLKFGALVGVDELGNKYYENKEEYAYGQHRWVEMAGFRSFYSCDASEIPPRWHAWLHSITDTPPAGDTVGTTHKFEPVKNSTGAHTPYKRNLGAVRAKWVPNKTQARPRGFGVGNGLDEASPIASEPHEEGFYTQPGYVLDKRHRHPKRDEGYTLLDTAEDVSRRRLAGARFGSAAAIAEAAMKQLGSGGEASEGPPTFALPVDDEAAAAAAAEDDRREVFASISERDLSALRSQVEKLEEVERRALALAGFNSDADAAIEDAQEQLEMARAQLRAAEALR